ncbi:Ig-like domain-containing protein, partial [Fibrobacterota bacterium]
PWKGTIRKADLELKVVQYNASGTVIAEQIYSYQFVNNSLNIDAKVEVAPQSLTLYVGGGTGGVTAKVLPSSSDQTVTWSSSDPNTAIVTAQGTVTAVAVGQCVITAASGALVDSALVMVLLDTGLALAGITVSPGSLNLFAGGDTGNLTVTTDPAGYEGLVNWNSSNDKVAAVSAAGVVTPLDSGLAVIAASSLADQSLSSVCTVVVNLDAPVIEPGGETFSIVNAEVDFTVRITQAYGELVLFKWDLDGDGLWDDSVSDFSSHLDFSHNMAHTYDHTGMYTARFEAGDSEGNTSAATLNVEIVNPGTVVITSPSQDTLVNTTPLTVSYNLDGQTATRDFNLLEGVNLLIIDSSNSAARSSDSVRITLDTEPPGPPGVSGTTPTNSTRPSWNWSSGGSADASGFYQYKLDDGLFSPEATATSYTHDTDLAEGDYTLFVRERDLAGNWSDSTVHTVTVDYSASPAPLFDDGTSTERYTLDQTPTWTWQTGGGSGVFRYKMNGAGFDSAFSQETTDASFTASNALADGDYTLAVIERDAAGNWSAEVSRTVTVDTEAPVVTITSPGNNFITNQATIAVSWTVNNVPQTSELTEILADGLNTVTRSNTDAAGNEGTASITVTLDTVAPVVVITTPVDNYLTNQSPVVINWTVDGANQTAQTTQDLNEGLNTITRSSTDTAGNVGATSITIILDTQPPVIAITSPHNRYVTSNSSITISWTVDGAVQTSQLTEGIADGPNTVTRTGTDNAGNRDSTSITIYRRSNVIFVDDDAGGAGTGTSWEDAYINFQTAIAAAVSGQEIWVAKGIYKPSSVIDRLATFRMVDGVSWYGGFDREPSIDERNLLLNLKLTLLSGDIGAEGDTSDNSYTVVTAADNALVNGFKISFGNANLTSQHGDNAHLGRGGGLFIPEFVSPTISNCIFQDNYAVSDGAGVANYYGSPEIINCVFHQNVLIHGEELSAGGGYSATSSAMVENSTSIINCTFSSNISERFGSAIYLWGGGPDLVLKNCIFTGNISGHTNHRANQIWVERPLHLYNCRIDLHETDPDVAEFWGYSGSIQTDSLNQAGHPVIGSDGIELISGDCCVDKGTSDGAPEKDIYNQPRNGPVDIGAFEVQ